MRVTIILKFICLLCVFKSQAQIDRYALSVDTVIEYTDGITQEIYLNFAGKKQGLYWGSIPKNNKVSSTKMFVRNNTGNKILVIRVSDPDGRISFLGRGNTLLSPGELLELKILVRFAPVSFTRPLHIDYELNGIRHQLKIPTWGTMIANDALKTVPDTVENKPADSLKSRGPKIIQAGNQTFIYDKSDTCPSTIFEKEPNKLVEYRYENCKLVSVRREFKRDKRTYSIQDSGIFENDLLTGKRNVYFDRVHLSYSINVVNGIERDTIFRGRIVNKQGPSGQKQGYWILTGKQCNYSVNDWQYLLDCDVCMQFYFPQNNAGADTVFVYDLNGCLYEEKFISTDSVFHVTRRFYPNGLKKSEQFNYVNGYHALFFSIVFSDSVPGQPLVKYYSDQTELRYRNGRIVQKISPRFGHKMSMEMPIEFPIPYTEENGIFKDELLYNGEINYYNEFSVLQKTERIVNGKKIR